jgi:hypothetical protein
MQKGIRYWAFRSYIADNSAMRVLTFILALFALFAAMACSSTGKPKKLKPGKPIPCPVKDC